MWGNVTDLFRTLTAFLSSTKAPPNTSVELYKAMRDENHFASKKFYITFTSFLGMMIFYFITVLILFFVPKENEMVVAYVQIFSKTIDVVAIIVASYLGTQVVSEFRFGGSTNTNFDSALAVEEIDQNLKQETYIVEEYLSGPKEDDYSLK